MAAFQIAIWKIVMDVAMNNLKNVTLLPVVIVILSLPNQLTMAAMILKKSLGKIYRNGGEKI